MKTENKKDLRWPKSLRADPAKLDKSKYIQFYKDVGYDTDDCQQLKDEIKFLIRKGKLIEFTKDGEKNNERRDYEDKIRNPQPRGPVINMIFWGTNRYWHFKKLKKGLHPRSHAYRRRSPEEGKD